MYNCYVVLSDDDTFDGDATIYQLNGDGENELEQGGFKFVSHNNVTDKVTLGDLLKLWNETYGTDF
jgi:hypothetical protein